MPKYKLIKEDKLKENKKLKTKLALTKAVSYLVPISTVAVPSALFLSGNVDFSNPKILSDILIFAASANSLCCHYKFKKEKELKDKIFNNEELIKREHLNKIIKELSSKEKDILIDYLKLSEELINFADNNMLVHIIESYEPEAIYDSLLDNYLENKNSKLIKK